MSKPQEKIHVQRTSSVPAQEHAHAGGVQMAPPTFGLNAGPIQQMPDPRVFDHQTNYRFDQGMLTFDDLQDPFIVQKLRDLGLDGLKAYLPKVKDPYAVQYIEQMIDDLITPAAANIVDDRAKVLPQDEQMYTSLTTYLQALPARLEALIQAPGNGNEWIQNNPNVQEVQKIISKLGSDFSSRKHVVRFDNTLLQGKVAAAYDFTGDVIRLRPATNNAEIATVAMNLVHEFTHHLQDVATEDAAMIHHKKQEHGRKEELEHEVEGRKTGVYASSLIQMLGDAQDKPEEIFSGPLFNDRVFTSRFESIRTAKTGKEKKEAQKHVDDIITKAYEEEGQFAANTPSAVYYAELGKYDNHIRLHMDKGQVDLGEVPGNIKTKAALEAHLSTTIDADPKKFGIFDKVTGKKVTKYAIVTILVFYQGKKLGDFAMKE